MGTDHYFSPTPPSGDEPKSSYRFTVEGRVLTIATDRGVFARKGLDAGTEV
ncbi:MAG: 16S rRNA methyltransferase, partial [Actinobacteria bacterium]|nr:16S rRNA methyltransferase [Actinomycetota bacterium]